MSRLLVGTSGFNYEHWRDGVFYPPRLPQREWLAYYAERFNSVELNVTFYRLPKESSFRLWADRTPDEFRFVIKGSRYVTHVKRLLEPREPVKRLVRTAKPMLAKTECVLWQLPPNLHADLGRLSGFLDALEREASQVRHCLEFRHASWYADEVADELEARNVGVCLTDAPLEAVPEGRASQDLGRPVARARVTSDLVYVRRHGPGKRFASGYPDDLVATDARWIRAWLREGRDVCAFYNNDTGGHAPRDALNLARRLMPVKAVENRSHIRHLVQAAEQGTGLAMAEA